MNQADTDRQIINEIVRILVELRADMFVIASVASWKDTQSDEQTLIALKQNGRFCEAIVGKEYLVDVKLN